MHGCSAGNDGQHTWPSVRIQTFWAVSPRRQSILPGASLRGCSFSASCTCTSHGLASLKPCAWSCPCSLKGNLMRLGTPSLSGLKAAAAHMMLELARLRRRNSCVLQDTELTCKLASRPAKRGIWFMALETRNQTASCLSM